MDMQKLNAVLSAMDAENIPQIIISDPAVIFYLTGAWIHPGERLLVLYLNRDGSHKFLFFRCFFGFTPFPVSTLCRRGCGNAGAGRSVRHRRRSC